MMEVTKTQKNDSNGPTTGNRYDIIVVGVGSVGACVCYQLAKRGVKTLGVERFAIPHAEGSYGGESRVFRTAYYEHADYVPLLRRARQLWIDMQREAGDTLYLETGGLYIGPRRTTAIDLIAGTLRAAKQHQLPAVELENGDVRLRYPQFRVPDDYVGVLEQHAGVLLSEKVVQTVARMATGHGAKIIEAEPVRRWTADARGVSVETERDKYHADKLVICAGAWSGPLLRDVQKYLTVTRQVLAWFEPADETPFQPDKFPIWGLDDGRPMLQYGFPQLSRVMPNCAPGIKIAQHCAGPRTSPDTVDRNAMPDELNAIRTMTATYLPDACGRIVASCVCLYTNSPDGHFLIDSYPQSDRVVFCAGLSGHGFKFASVLGEALADLALAGRTALPIDFLSMRRFRK